MSLGLIQPGASVALRHPRTGELIKPIGFIRGKAVWPVMGGSGDNDDENDPRYSGGGGSDDDSDDDADDEDDEDSDDDEDDDDKGKRKAKKTSKSKKDDDDEDDEDDDEDDHRPRAVRQAAKYRTRLRAEERRTAELNARIKELENRDKNPDEVVSEELKTARSEVESLTEVNRIMSAQLAFFKTRTGIEWADASDAFALAEREGLFDDVIDEDGTVDTRELRRGLKDLAKRKPHLVVKPKNNGRADSDDSDDEEEEERPRRSARSANGSRKGARQNGVSRAELAKKFPVLRVK